MEYWCSSLHKTIQRFQQFITEETAAEHPLPPNFLPFLAGLGFWLKTADFSFVKYYSEVNLLSQKLNIGASSALFKLDQKIFFCK